VAALTYPVRPRPVPWPWGADPVVVPRAARPRRSTVPPAVLLRRRLAVSAVLIVILAASVTAARVLAGLLGSAPPATPEQVPAVRVVTVSHVTHVVQPGDTLWQIARDVQPGGDVRTLVDRLTKARHGRPLQVGEVIAVS